MTDAFTAPSELPVPTDASSLGMHETTSVIGEWLQEVIWARSARSARSLQRTPGPSSLGTKCDRELAYAAAGTPPANLNADPWAAIVGTAVHAWMSALFTELDGGTSRYLVEHSVSYRGVRGTTDLYDRRRRLVIDWKTCKLDKLRSIRKHGPPHSHIVQAQIYAAGLAEAGEDPVETAITFLPVDGRLTDLHVWSAEVNPHVAEAAVARMSELAKTGPAAAKATPSRLCPWCDHYRPDATDLAVACPGPMTRGRSR